MSRLVRDYVEIGDHLPLDELLARLTALRAALGDEAEPRVQLRGDDIFGRHISISFLRTQTAEEAACEARYAHLSQDKMMAAA